MLTSGCRRVLRMLVGRRVRRAIRVGRGRARRAQQSRQRRRRRRRGIRVRE